MASARCTLYQFICNVTLRREVLSCIGSKSDCIQQAAKIGTISLNTNVVNWFQYLVKGRTFASERHRPEHELLKLRNEVVESTNKLR